MMDYYSNEELAESQDTERDPERYDYSCMPAEEVWSLLDHQVQELSQQIGVSYHTARAALQHLHWQSDVVVQWYASL